MPPEGLSTREGAAPSTSPTGAAAPAPAVSRERAADHGRAPPRATGEGEGDATRDGEGTTAGEGEGGMPLRSTSQ
jgi:hypothetical protein